MNMKKYSIIIPCYNSKETIGRALSSIVEQECNDLEVIICDDRSTDNFMDVVNTFNDKLCIRYFRTNDGEPKGPSNARNLGIKNANGEWLIFLDSDDALSENAIFILNEHIMNGEENFIFCPFRYNFNTVFFESKLALQGKCFNRQFLLDNEIMFNTELYTEEDYNFIMKVLYTLKGQNKGYTHDKDSNNHICEHIENPFSMVHTIKSYWETTYRYFVNGYGEPSLWCYKKYPHLRDFLIGESMHVFIMHYYRFQYLRECRVDNIGYYKGVLNNLYKDICITYGFSYEDFKEEFLQEPRHKNAILTLKVDMNIDNVEVLNEKYFEEDFRDVNLKPLFSIVIPCFKCKDSISQTLESILTQDEKDYEVLICDDRSTDNFMDIVKSYKDRMFIRYYCTEEDTLHCPSNPRQLGLDHANGEWVVFIDSDDKLSQTALSDYRICIEENAKNMIWGGFSKGEDVYYNSRIALHGKAFNVEFLRKNDIRFNTHIFMEEDYDFIQKVLYTIEGKGDLYYRWNKVFYLYTVESNSSSMSSLGNKYFEKTYESFLQSRFNPIIDSYLKYGTDEFGRRLFYTIYLCYFKYLYFKERNNEAFMGNIVEKNKRYLTRALGVLGIDSGTVVNNIDNSLFENARWEVKADMEIEELNETISFKKYIKEIIVL